ncbi:MAG: type II toxin-antitoxin system Phd/YefM family antitoxin [Gemmatimonadetes bacterium]|nr:type II toxin-antitoxin system Phd/YefM family antitoxin [Gemmatimonadota bacterium]
MGRTYSLYEAKARFSEIMRRVREGQTVTVSYHGEPVAEIRPVSPSRTVEERLDQLQQRGLLSPPPATKPDWQPLARRPGALKRFLRDRE